MNKLPIALALFAVTVSCLVAYQRVSDPLPGVVALQEAADPPAPFPKEILPPCPPGGFPTREPQQVPSRFNADKLLDASGYFHLGGLNAAGINRHREYKVYYLRLDGWLYLFPENGGVIKHKRVYTPSEVVE